MRTIVDVCPGKSMEIDTTEFAGKTVAAEYALRMLRDGVAVRLRTIDSEKKPLTLGGFRHLLPYYVVRENTIYSCKNHQPIPADEPLFLLRATNIYSLEILNSLSNLPLNGDERDLVLDVWHKFFEYMDRHGQFENLVRLANANLPNDFPP